MKFFTKYNVREVKLAAIHQYQLSNFFFVISHIPVKAAAIEKASAHVITLWKKLFFKEDKVKKITT
jgi:hypothetical protein